MKCLGMFWGNSWECRTRGHVLLWGSGGLFWSLTVLHGLIIILMVSTKCPVVTVVGL